MSCHPTLITGWQATSLADRIRSIHQSVAAPDANWRNQLVYAPDSGEGNGGDWEWLVTMLILTDSMARKKSCVLTSGWSEATPPERRPPTEIIDIALSQKDPR